MEKFNSENIENQSPAERIAAVTSFEELDTLIDDLGQIMSVSGTYSALTLKRAIKDARNDFKALVGVTSAEGLRDKVEMLLQSEQYEALLTKNISEASNFDELFSVLDNFGTIAGSSQTFTAENIKNLILEAQAIEKEWSTNPLFKLPQMTQIIKTITRRAGLRNKVIDLFVATTDDAFQGRFEELKSGQSK